MPIEDDGGVLKGLGRTALRGQEVSRSLSQEASLSFLRAFLTADFRVTEAHDRCVCVSVCVLKVCGGRGGVI